MAKYRVYLQTIASTSVEVEADSKDEALDAALSGTLPTICAQCSGWGRKENLELSDVWDIPSSMSVDESVEEVA